MNRIHLEAALANQLHHLTGSVELCDSSGRVLGRFVPSLDCTEWEPLGAEPTEEELAESERSAEWHSTADVLAFLQNLEKNGVSGSDGNGER